MQRRWRARRLTQSWWRAAEADDQGAERDLPDGSRLLWRDRPRDRIEGPLETSMVTRAERLQDFITDADPPVGSVVEVLCEDHVGTYRPALALPEHARGPAERAHG